MPTRIVSITSVITAVPKVFKDSFDWLLDTHLSPSIRFDHLRPLAAAVTDVEKSVRDRAPLPSHFLTKQNANPTHRSVEKPILPAHCQL